MGAVETNANLGVGNPGSALSLLGATFKLYARFPVLFFVLAAAVVVPYDLALLAITGVGPLEVGRLGWVVSQLLMPVDWLLIAPLISALHVHAVREVRAGRRPRLLPVFRDGLRVLPVVTVVTFVSWLAITAGLFVLVVPGVILWMRWSVAAQAAAIDNCGWKAALQSSRLLAMDRWGEVFLLIFSVGIVTSAPSFGLMHVFPRGSTSVASVSCGVVYSILSRSFTALAISLLFFDLRESRPEATGANAPVLIAELGAAKDPLKTPPGAKEARAAVREVRPDAASVSPVGNPLDPRSYTDAERPRGWWIDPANPGRMRYWGVGDRQVWAGTTRTPRKLRHAWRTEDGGELPR